MLLVEEKIWGRDTHFKHICCSRDLVAASGVDNVLRVCSTDSLSFSRWRCSGEITCIAAVNQQITVATAAGSVFVLYFTNHHGIQHIETKSRISLLDAKRITQIRLHEVQTGTADTQCFIYAGCRVYSCKWAHDTIKAEITQHSLDQETPLSVPGEYCKQVPGTGTLSLMGETNEDFPFNYDVCTPTETSFVRISKDRASLDLFRDFKSPVPSILKNESKFYVIDISQDGWILVQDRCKGKLLLIKGEKRFTFKAKRSSMYTSGCFVSTSLRKVRFVLQSRKPSALALIEWKLSRDARPRLEHVNSDADNIFGRGIVAYGDNIAFIWNDRLKKHSAVGIIKPSEFRNDGLMQHYTPTWIPPDLKSGGKIISYARYPNDDYPSGALLLRDGGFYALILWNYRNHSFEFSKHSIERYDEESYVKIAMSRQCVCLCSQPDHHNRVTMQYWMIDRDDITGNRFEVISRIEPNAVVQLIGTGSRFYFAAGRRLWSSSRDKYDANRKVTKLVYNSESKQIKASLSDAKSSCLVSYNEDLAHSDFDEYVEAQTVFGPNGTTWVSEKESRLQFFSAGDKNPIEWSFPFRYDLSSSTLLSGGEFLVKDLRDEKHIKICSYSLKRQNERSKNTPRLNWSLDWNHKEPDGEVHSINDLLFLIRGGTFSVIGEDEEGNKAEEVLFGYRY